MNQRYQNTDTGGTKSPILSSNGNGTLSGVNALGILLMELRMKINQQNPIKKVLPSNIDGFLLYGNKIETTYAIEITLEDF